MHGHYYYSLPPSLSRHSFKAHPLNPKVIAEQGLMGVPKKTHHPATQPHTPKLATKERGEVRGHRSDESENENHSPFKARPLPKGLFDKVSVSICHFVYLCTMHYNIVCWLYIGAP